MKKAYIAARMLEERIAHINPKDGSLTERQLAEDLGMSRTTVRDAVQQLVERGLLIRLANKRLDIAPHAVGQNNLNIGFIAPAGPSGDLGDWWTSVKGVLQDQPVNLHSIAYESWESREIQEALLKYDGAFFIAPAAKLSEPLIRKFKAAPCRVVVLDQDVSAEGLPSITLFPPHLQQKLFDHLYRLGHRRLDCLNTQERGVIIEGRIAAWREYIQSHGMTGRLHSLERYKPTESAYRLIREALQEKQSIAPALFCTTGPGAVGAMRSLYEAGLKIGTDVSVCAVNSEGQGRYMMPTLTALESPPRAHYLQRAAQWILNKDEWQGPLLIQPEDIPLFEGESTGPAPFALSAEPSRPQPKEAALN